MMKKKQVNLKSQLVSKLVKIKEKGLNNGISNFAIRKELCKKLDIGEAADRKSEGEANEFGKKKFLEQQWLLYVVIPVVVAILIWYVNAGFSIAEMRDDIVHSHCLLEQNAIVQEITRPIVNCSMCRGLTKVREVENIGHEDFIINHAYTGVPLLVRGATKHWSALHTFNYSFFKDIYTNTKGALDSTDEECQYFAYKTNLMSLREVFEMSDDRAAFKANETPWYIGWSNCDPVVSVELRKHYNRPYFLPNQTEASVLDWIFMGGFGPGAMIHIDYVQRPSWQAQISGSKRWTLIPPPECERECGNLEVTVRKGDIVCINTNEWYHDTYIEEGEISITIGSEYD